MSYVSKAVGNVPVMDSSVKNDARSCSVGAPVRAKDEVALAKPHSIDNLIEKSENLKQAIKLMVSEFDSSRGLAFEYDSSIDRVIIRVSENDQVIKTIPSEVFIRIAHAIDQFKGQLCNESA